MCMFACPDIHLASACKTEQQTAHDALLLTLHCTYTFTDVPWWFIAIVRQRIDFQQIIQGTAIGSYD